LEIVLGKLDLAGWVNWAIGERTALEGLFKASFEAALESDDPAWCVDGWICGLGRAGLDLSPFLAQLLQPANHMTLGEYFSMNAGSLAKKGRLCNPFWPDDPTRELQAIEFLQSTIVQVIVWPQFGARPS